MSCTNKISDRGGTHDQTFSYSSGATQTVFPTLSYSTVDDLFSNSDSTNCPITTCLLSDAGSCDSGTQSWTGGEISMLSVSPWTITASRGVAAGYTISICLKCWTNNNVGSGKIDNMVITQEPQCANTLTAGSATAISEAYVSGGSVTITPTTGFTTWDAFFSNTDTTNCPITSCSIANSGSCGGSLTGTEASLGSSSPWDVSMEVDVPIGYTKHICI